MADKITLIVTLRKDVQDDTAGKALYEVVKQKLSDHPEVKVNGHISHYLELEGQ